MATALVSNPVSLSGGSGDSAGKKKKRNHRIKNNRRSKNYKQWKSESQQQLYSSKLVLALRQIRIASNESPRRGRAVRVAADRILATTAGGRTKWSRAILTNRLKRKFRNHKRRRAPSAAEHRLKKPRVGVRRLQKKCLPAVKKKVGILGRLIPGCRKEPLPVILEEVTDYIAALEMQVRAMSAVAGLLSGDTSGGGSAYPPHH